MMNWREKAYSDLHTLFRSVSQPESAANAQQAMADYIAVIRREALLRSGQGSGDDLLLAAQRRYQEKKAYMEEKP